MNSLLVCYLFLSSFFFVHDNKEETLTETVERGLQVSTEQSYILAKQLKDSENLLPRTFEGGKLKTTDYKSWVSGFFPGLLWYLYENNTSGNMKTLAYNFTNRLELAKDMKGTHDLGFILYCSYGNGYRLTGNATFLKILEEGSKTLSMRFNKKVGAIKSWESTKKWQFPVIIDNMMNLQLLTFTGKLVNNSNWINIATKHAHTTLINHFRPDNSCYHVVTYDSITGKAVSKQTHQGYSDHSSWSRGQAWALYGFTMMYKETKKKEFLVQAQKIATFIKNNSNLPEDKIPYWDFDAPDIPNTPRDASSAAIMASAFIELSLLDNSIKSKDWLDIAIKQIRSLSSSQYLATVGSNGGFILKHSVGNYNKNSEIDVPLTYADYYYVEALIRLKKYILNNK